MAGKRFKVYYDTAADFSDPTWVEINRAVDIKLPQSKTEVDASRRESEEELVDAGLRKRSLEFDYRLKVGEDTVYEALLASFESDTNTHFAVANGDIATPGVVYTHFWGQVFTFDVDAALNGEDKIPVKIGQTGESPDGDFAEAATATVAGGT
jgi:hypothetical protein